MIALIAIGTALLCSICYWMYGTYRFIALIEVNRKLMSDHEVFKRLAALEKALGNK